MGSQDKDQFDDLLDGTLRQYGKVEPRAGLEGRVLAKLANAGSPRRQLSWTWALAGAIVTVLLLFAVWIGMGRHKPKARQVAIQPNASRQSVTKRAVVTEPGALKRSVPKRARPRRMPVTTAKIAAPRLEQFPSPRPISEQEAMLVQYVQRYPEEALLVAQQQNEFEEQVKLAEEEIEKSSSSDQPKR
jgi:hypothetical protein